MLIRANPDKDSEGKFQIDIEHLQLEIEDFKLYLDGGDVASVLNYFSDYIFQIMKESLLGVLQQQTIDSIEGMLNHYISKREPKADFPDYALEFELGLVGEGIVITEDWMAIPVEGTFHPLDNFNTSG